MRDDFVRRLLPAATDCPDFVDLGYPEQLNAAVELLGRENGEAIAVRTTAGAAITYAALRDLSDRIARLLVEGEGLVPGNRVLLFGPNTIMLTAAWLAILKAGGIAVAAMPMLRDGEIAAIAGKAAISHAIVDARCRAAIAGTELPALRSVLVFDGDDGTGALEAMLAATAPGFASVATRNDDPALIAFTSGTTGTPKGTVHFHRDILAVADCFAGPMLQPRRGDIWCGTPPIAFTFGLGALVIFPLRFRGTALILTDTAPAAIADAIAAHRVTILFTAPTAYKAMLAAGAAGPGLASLRTCVSAGEHLPAETWSAWKAATGIGLVNGIGATEMMHIFIAGDTPGALGRPVPGYEAAILDDSGQRHPRGTGRLAVRGPTGCRYLGEPRQSNYVVAGWNVTGDTCRIDADGLIWYVARADDMIVSSGYNIAPPEVEAALLSHPAVAECAVVGVPDAARGMVVKAFVVTRGPAGDAALARALQDHVKAVIAPYKYPRAVAFVGELPRTATGKLQRHRLRGGALP